ncbi:MAG: beta-ketoacyl-ACP synthase II [Fusobacteria bacterium]|nr:beta-ketoacyl-ACP synthase II [Fusobacteriota bacterium]
MKRVVVTGIGLLTSLGEDKDTTWKAIIEGKTGVGYIENFDASGFGVKIGAQVKGFKPEDYIEKKEMKKLGRFSQYAIAASKMALADANFEITEKNECDVGVMVSSGIGGLEVFEQQYDILLAKGPKRVSPFTVPAMIANMSSGNVGIYTGAKGPNKTIVTACACGTHSIGDSFEMIKSGKITMMIAGGSEAAITRLGLAGFAALKALTFSFNDNPEKSSRPFTANRDGFVMGEGAGVLILEELEHAKARGVKIYAEIIGYGETGDAYHLTAPATGDKGGAARAMKMALDQANLEPSKIDYINAHGTSTPLNDVIETQAIKYVFGDHAYKVAVSSTKGATGHCLGAAGGIEGALLALSLDEGILPPTINYDTPDPECDLDYVPNVARKQEIEYAMSNSFGFGGQNAVIIMKKYRG